MEEIRIAAMEALVSVPHGGAEIGGVLWGTRSGGRVRILAARPLECEHALGPSFTLSAKDYVRLAAMLHDGLKDGLKNGSPNPRAQDWEALGWYHSHTRSEVLLSERDLQIHNRYFPDPWQVALVVHPHIMQPMRAGFFFREANGSIHSDSSYSEFVVQPAPDSAVVQPAPHTVLERPAPEAMLQAVSPAAATNWRWWAVSGMAVVLFALMAIIFKNVLKNDWTRVFATDPPHSLALMAYDLNGQLQIHWDFAADPIRSAEAGTLDIADGATHTVVALEKQRLRGGSFSYVRTGARVDIRLAVRQPGGRVYQEFTGFLGKAGEPQPGASALELRHDLQDQAVRIAALEDSVASLRLIVRHDQKTRTRSPR
jgi:proteasome lid subunit RPN8/RPN11